MIPPLLVETGLRWLTNNLRGIALTIAIAALVTGLLALGWQVGSVMHAAQKAGALEIQLNAAAMELKELRAGREQALQGAAAQRARYAKSAQDYEKQRAAILQLGKYIEQLEDDLADPSYAACRLSADSVRELNAISAPKLAGRK